MVSKVAKRTPTKPYKARNSRRKNRSPIKNTAASVVASINRSIFICRRRLVKIFAKLSLTTPQKTPTPRRKKGYQILHKPPTAARRTLFTLPPPPSPAQKTVFLDLDETLVHSTPHIPPENHDFVVRPVIDGRRVEFFVLKRPFVDDFLSLLHRRGFEIVIFTAGIEEYASLVVDELDWGRLVSHRLYRDSCREVDGKFVKDLSVVGRNLDRAVILDDNPSSYQLQPENAIPIKAFVDDLKDEELKVLMEFFAGCDLEEDMRDSVKDYFGDLYLGNSLVFSALPLSCST